jgi:hypothetical protein
MFNMGGVKDAKVSNTGNFLGAGIHTVTFRGINKAEGFNALELHFEAVDGSGVHNERIFEPRSSERKESMYGTNPSEAEQFLCKIKQVIEALDPELAQAIDKNGEKFAAADFDGFVALLKKYLDKSVGKQTQIKLVPTTGNYVGFPGFIASLSKDGNIYMKTKVIGDNLVLNARELKQIDEASKAKPTKMASAMDDELSDLKEDLDSTSSKDDDDDLPF